jgi:hypothetical protein
MPPVALAQRLAELVSDEALTVTLEFLEEQSRRRRTGRLIWHLGHGRVRAVEISTHVYQANDAEGGRPR